MPNIIDLPTSDHLLQDIEQQEMSNMLSTQAGFGASQMTPADKISPKKYVIFFKVNVLRERIEIFVSFMLKIFSELEIVISSVVVLELICVRDLSFFLCVG